MLPRGGLALPLFGLGGAPLGGLYRAMSDADAAALLAASWQLGVRLFDTAPYYGYTRSERHLGAALAEWPRDELVLGTKVGRVMRDDASVQPGDDGWADPLPWRPHYDYTRAGVMRSVEDSLQRLGVSHIDIVFVHDIGRATHGDRHEFYWQQLTHGGGFRVGRRPRRERMAGCARQHG